MQKHNQKLGNTYSIFTAFIVVFILLAPVACDNGGGGNESNQGPPYGDLPDWAQHIASAGAERGLRYLISASGISVPDFIENPLVGLIIGNLFKGGPTPPDPVRQALSQIQATLADMENKLASIATQLSYIEQQLAIDTSEIEKQVAVQGMNPYVTHTNGLWAQYIALHNPDGTWVTDNTKLQTLAVAILDSNEGEFPQLQAIHDLLTGENDVSGGTLAAVAKAAQIAVTSGGKTNFDSYMLIENYFGSVLRVQTRGATLMMEALKYQEANTRFQGSVGLYPGTATGFATWYQKQIEDEVEVFLQQTESFVTALANPQQSFDALVPDADKIFWRADLIAAWLSSKHRLDPNNKPDGQQFIVYRVIGGPDRVSKYSTSFPAPWGGSGFSSIQFNATGEDADYSVPLYTQADHHGYSTSPYVQSGAPMDNNGGAKQKGVLMDADEIWTGVYCAPPRTGAPAMNELYYLNDIPTHATYAVQYNAVNSAGQTPQAGDEQILYGYAFDIQHPPAILMGDWHIVLSHDSQSGLQYGLSHWLNGSATPGSQSVYLGVDAWPTVQCEEEDNGYCPMSGNFQQENAMVGNYYWGGSTCCPHLNTNYTASMSWNIQSNGAPGNRNCGTFLWVERADQSNSYGDYDYNSVGSGTDSGIQGNVTIDMVPGEAFYISLGARMFITWDGITTDEGVGYQHWQGNYNIALKELHFELPQ